MVFLKKAWAFLKAYWYVPVALIGVILALVLRKKNVVDWAEILDNARNSHLDEVDAIDRAHELEIARREQALKRMEEARKAIESEYRARQKELDSAKKKEIERILKKTKDDPQAMADELEKSTGYRVIVVE